MANFDYEKDRFLNFIERYFLNGKVEGAVIESKNKTLTTVFKNSSADIRGVITLENFALKDCEIGCYNTGRLIAMMGILENKVDIAINLNDDDSEVVSLVVRDAKGKKISFATSELDMIDRDGKKGKVKTYETIVSLNNEVINDILKANTAIDKNSGISFVKRKDKFFIVFGKSTTNTDNIEFELEADVLDDDFEEVSFQSEIMKEILFVAGRRFEEARLEISSQGIMRLYFKDNEITSEYWLIKLN